MKKIVLWLMSTLTVLVLLFGYHTSTSSTSAAAVRGGNASLAAPVQGGTGSSASSDTFSTSGVATSSSSAAAAARSSSTPAPPAPAAAPAATTSKVTGSVASTRWGPVQVQLSVANKKITNVAVVQYPTGNGRDQEINSYALPQLIQETLKAQSANIDMVSGATYTSNGYLQSLQSALDKAGI